MQEVHSSLLLGLNIGCIHFFKKIFFFVSTQGGLKNKVAGTG